MRIHYRPGQRSRAQFLLSHYPHKRRDAAHRQSGAALIIALAILMVLLSLAITFILIVRYESNIAQQTFDRARAEHLLDGALAQAEYRLNRDLEVHADALSLDHGWRSWFSGAAFAGKQWTRAQQGTKKDLSLAGGGLVAINIEEVERAVRGLLDNGLIYVRFPQDKYMEPLFRGPRTEHWLHVPRNQEGWVLLFAPAGKARLVTAAGTVLDGADGNDFTVLNDALNTAGLPHRFARLSEAQLADPRAPGGPGFVPDFVTTDFLNRDNPAINGGLPQEQVNRFADVDSDGDGMKDAIWMPLARDVNHHGDGIDNDLDGIVDNMQGIPGEPAEPAFEAAPFVYHGLGLPPAAVDENPEALAAIRGIGWNDVPLRWQETAPIRRDGFDNNNINAIDGADEDGLFLTVPLPNLIMQIDLNSDGIFDLRDSYEAPGTGDYGPLYVQLPDTIFVPVMTGLNAAGEEQIDRQPVGMPAVDVLDNDHDLMVNGFRAYAYVSLKEKFGYHNINIDQVLENGRDSLRFFYISQNGARVNLTPAVVANVMDITKLRVSCSGEPVSAIAGRYAVNITDEAGKVNFNTAGGYTQALNGTPDRALDQGASTFEYETRLVPALGLQRPLNLWHMRTGADGDGYSGVEDPLFEDDAFQPGYGGIDDNGNALLLGLSRTDFSGDGLPGAGLFSPRLSLNADTWDNIQTYLQYRDDFERGTRPWSDLYGDDLTPIGWAEFQQWRPYYLKLGRFAGVDEPAELHLFNPMPNLVAESLLGQPGRYGDRLLLRKEELNRYDDIGDTRWDYLRQMVTANSDTRNTFHAYGRGDINSYLRIDPNFATPQQIAGSLILRGTISNIVDGMNFNGLANPAAAAVFAEGLRQFDTAFTGDLLGVVRTAAGAGERFPADPVLQVMRLAADMAAARDRSAGRHRLVTENVISNPVAYQDFWGRTGLEDMNNLPPPNPPLEPLNERERIPDDEVMPLGDVQEFLNTSLGLTTDDKRILAPDSWWKYNQLTNEDRLFEYATASLDAIRINELMVRPVRRVEAETNPISAQAAAGGTYTADFVANLDPAPYRGMPTFYMDRFRNLNITSLWNPHSAYDDQPLLGDHTAYVLDLLEDPTAINFDELSTDILEFRFHASEGLPAGRYYLTVNVTDQYGVMSVVDPGVLDYAIKYAPRGGTEYIQDDVAFLVNQGFQPEAVDTLFLPVNTAEYIATPAARDQGSAAAPGWIFLPNDAMYPDPGVFQGYYNFQEDQLLTYIDSAPANLQWNALQNDPGFPSDGFSDWMDPAFQEFLINWLLGKGLPDPADVVPGLNPQKKYPMAITDLDDILIYVDWLTQEGILYAWTPPQTEQLLGELLVWDKVFRRFEYFREGMYDGGFPAPPGLRTYTVVVPPVSDPTVTPQYDLCVALRLNPQRVADWMADPTNVPKPSLAVNFFDFSQEPSHEYLELANVSDEEVDVGGWRLEIGVPDPPGVERDKNMRDPYKSVWKIPLNTRVAPGGHLLLGFDVLDNFMSAYDTPPAYYPAPVPGLIGINGMGLAKNSTLELKTVTEPPIADNSPSQTGLGTPVYGGFEDDTGSVFRREDGQDYVDNDGDGLSSRPVVFDWNRATADNRLANEDYGFMEGIPAPNRSDSNPTDDNIWDDARYEHLDTDRVLEEYKTHGGNANGVIPPWSRIVQLENEYLWKENTRAGTSASNGKYDPHGRNTEDVKIEDINNPARLAHLILRGGILPNYPERDGIDNDGDGGYVVDKGGAGVVVKGVQATYSEEPLLGYVAGALDKDMIDNNLDYLLDERGNEIFVPGVTTPVTLKPVFDRHGMPFLSEGVDEGHLGTPVYFYNAGTNAYDIQSGFRGFFLPMIPRVHDLPRFYGHGSFEASYIPLWNIRGNIPVGHYRNDWIIGNVVSGNNTYYSDGTNVYAYANVTSPLRPEEGFPWALLVDSSYANVVNYDKPPVIAEPRDGNLYSSDSPDWQSFVERRWNPGDNVIVTLYVGHPENRRIADQATYREYDVINRTLDDVMPSPYAVFGFTNYAADATGVVSWLGSGAGLPQVCLDPPDASINYAGKLSFWLPDHMGLDFYRSLERKHPLYHGDRFGTANRWTVTDGAYDDWADSISWFKQGLGAVDGGDVDSLIPGQVVMNDPSGDPVFTSIEAPRFRDDVDAAGAKEQALQLFGHAMWGSPLRMNTQARLWENPGDLAQLGFADPVWNVPVDHNRNRRPGRQFPGLDTYRNTAHNLNQTSTGAPLERRAAADWALRRAVLRKAPFRTPGDLLDLPFLSFEKVIEGPDQYFSDPGGNGIYWPQYAVAPVNTRYMFNEGDQEIPVEVNFTLSKRWSSLFTYGYDRDLTSALASQGVLGGGASVMKNFSGLGSVPVVEEALEVTAMNPVVLTVGQARVVPLWPAPPDALNPNTNAVFTQDQFEQLFRWDNNLPPHNWTPVYLFESPMPGAGNPVTERPWLRVNYPRRMSSPPMQYSMTRADGDPLALPVYLFNGYFVARKLFPKLSADIDEVNTFLAEYLWPRWPVPLVASVIASDYDQRAPANRSVMYVSNHNAAVGGQNRAEALFVWDRESGLENGSYVAYVGTFVPGLTKAIVEAQQLLVDAKETAPLVNAGALTDNLLGLDPENPANLASPGGSRFDTRLAMEFITDRRYAEQMLPEDVDPDVMPGLLHPRKWATEAVGDPSDPLMERGSYFRADKEGYILYASDTGMVWRPLVVRVTDNFLALRVRNMGGPGEVACVSHVVLAPAPRTRGAVNVNTAETHRAVVSGEGASAVNWTVELFNALMGLPGAANVLNPEGDRRLPPYLPEVLGMPQALIPKDTPSVPADPSSPPIDPWRQRWLDIAGTDQDEAALLAALGNMPPVLEYVLNAPIPTPLTLPGDTGSPGSWTRSLQGRALLRLVSLMAGGRAEHPDGRYYVSPSELLAGIPLGGIALADERTGPWPLSNWGYPGNSASNDDEFTPRWEQRVLPERHEVRYNEIVARFSQMSNMITTRSDVFEIIATVQSGTVGDVDGDGVLDYRGDEFFPQSERRARVVYDRRARAIRQDESRE